MNRLLASSLPVVCLMIVSTIAKADGYSHLPLALGSEPGQFYAEPAQSHLSLPSSYFSDTTADNPIAVGGKSQPPGNWQLVIGMGMTLGTGVVIVVLCQRRRAPRSRADRQAASNGLTWPAGRRTV